MMQRIITAITIATTADRINERMRAIHANKLYAKAPTAIMPASAQYHGSTATIDWMPHSANIAA